MVALGGALGGIFVALVAPRLFSGYWEYELGLMASYGLVMFLVGRDLLQWIERRPAWLGWTMVGAAGLGFAVLVGALGWHAYSQGRNVLAQTRNFYGVLKVTEELAPYPRIHKHVMYHGVIWHGFQYRLPARRSWPTLYFGRRSGVGIAIEHHPLRAVPDRSFRLGVVGLGAGTLSAYGNDPEVWSAHDKRAADHLRFYEINPQAVNLAETHFTYLDDALGRGVDLDIFLGDARIVMERQLEQGEAQQFDVLVVDAFSGDSIPMHLLTLECFDLYWKHLNPDGILAIHISNRYLDLRPVVQNAAEELGKQAFFVAYEGDNLGGLSSSWTLVTNNDDFIETPAFQQAYVPGGMNRARRAVWTDDFSSLFEVLD